MKRHSTRLGLICKGRPDKQSVFWLIARNRSEIVGQRLCVQMQEILAPLVCTIIFRPLIGADSRPFVMGLHKACH